MMSVYEYASDVDKSLDYIFELCKKLNINVSNEDDMLSDDDIILLDNEIENSSLDEEMDENNDVEEELEDSFDDESDDSYEEELEEVKIVATVKKKKKNNVKTSDKDNNFAMQK